MKEFEIWARAVGWMVVNVGQRSERKIIQSPALAKLGERNQ